MTLKSCRDDHDKTVAKPTGRTKAKREYEKKGEKGRIKGEICLASRLRLPLQKGVGTAGAVTTSFQELRPPSKKRAGESA